MTPETLQVYRCVDKFDKLGREGIVALLQKPLSEFGAGLDRVRAEFIGRFLDIQGASNEAILDHMQSFMELAGKVERRLRLMAVLDHGEGETLWDKLMAMRGDEDQTWEGGGRPANIAWALDDIIKLVQNKHKGTAREIKD